MKLKIAKSQPLNYYNLIAISKTQPQNCNRKTQLQKRNRNQKSARLTITKSQLYHCSWKFVIVKSQLENRNRKTQSQLLNRNLKTQSKTGLGNEPFEVVVAAAGQRKTQSQNCQFWFLVSGFFKNKQMSKNVFVYWTTSLFLEFEGSYNLLKLFCVTAYSCQQVPQISRHSP